MRRPPRTELRGGRWWYRRRVPTELVEVLGFSEYRESLHTSDIEEARVRASLRDAQVTAELQAARAALAQRQLKPAPRQEPLSPEVLEYIRGAVKAYLLRLDEQFRRSGPDEDSRVAYESILADHLEETGNSLAFGKPATSDGPRALIEEALREVGFDPAGGGKSLEDALFRATEGYNEALQAVFRRSEGFYVPTPSLPPKPASEEAPRAALRLGAVIDQYLAGIKQSGYTRKVRRCLQLFGEVIGRETPVSEIKQKAVTAFMRDICRLPSDWAAQFDKGAPIAALLAGEHEEVMSPTTFRDNYRAPLKAFLVDSLRDHGEEGFPALTVDRLEYVGDRRANEGQQRALHVDELKRLFEGEEFAAIAKDPERESLYWFCVLSLFTGARPRELCQVNPQVDYGQTEEGHWFIDLNPHSAAGAGIKKTIKTGEERRIPLHPELCRLGVPAYLERLKKAGADRLFPGFKVKKGNPFEASGAVFTQLLKDCGLYDDQAPAGRKVLGAYVMRKTFITLARNQGVVSREITGHSDGTTTAIQERHYIFGPEPFVRKLAELQKFSLPVVIPIRS